MGCGVFWQQVKEVEQALSTMERYGIDPGSEAVRGLQRTRVKLMAEIGRKFPRIQDWLVDWASYSPTLIRLAHDPEIGFVAVVKESPGAPPVYKSVSDQVAMAILKKEVTPELEAQLLEPVEYYGE